MIEMTQNEIGDLTTKLMDISTIYPDAPDDRAIRCMAQALSSFKFDDVVGALNLHIRNPDIGQDFPRACGIVRMIRGDGLTPGFNEWGRIMDQSVRGDGVAASVVFDDPITMHLLDRMNIWFGLIQWTHENVACKALEFAERYRDLLCRVNFNYPNKIIGVEELSARERGQKYTKPPVLVGDIDSCREIFASGRSSALDDLMNRMIEGKQQDDGDE